MKNSTSRSVIYNKKPSSLSALFKTAEPKGMNQTQRMDASR